MTRMPSCFAWCMNSTKSPSVPCFGSHAVELRHVVAVVPVRGRVERLQPDAGDAEAGQIVEPAGQPREVPDAVAVAVQNFSTSRQ